MGGLLQVYLGIAWDDTNEIAVSVAFENQGLEHLTDDLA